MLKEILAKHGHSRLLDKCLRWSLYFMDSDAEKHKRFIWHHDSKKLGLASHRWRDLDLDFRYRETCQIKRKRLENWTNSQEVLKVWINRGSLENKNKLSLKIEGKDPDDDLVYFKLLPSYVEKGLLPETPKLWYILFK